MSGTLDRYIVRAEDIQEYGLKAALFLAYLGARTAEAATQTEVGKVWVSLTIREVAYDLDSSRTSYNAVINGLLEREVIERRSRESGNGYEYYYPNERLTRLSERLKTLSRRVHGWSNGAKGVKLTPQEHSLMLQEGSLALNRGEPLVEVVETMKTYLTLLRKGKKDIDYEVARYIAVYKDNYVAALKAKDTSPTRPRPKEVTA